MKIKNIVTVLLVAIILASCAPAVKVVPTETAVPMSTFTLVPPTPTSTPTPPIETLPVTQKSVSQFVSSMQTAGINITAEQILQQKLEIQTLIGADGKQYEIATAHLDPDPSKQGEILEGDYPLLIKTEKGWNEATLQNIAKIVGWDFGALLNLDRNFRDITINNFGMGNAYIDWNLVQAKKGVWDFSDPDYNINTADEAGVDVMANLIWGNNIAQWAKDDPDLHAVMIDYITQVMTHYKGKVKIWNVYNEAQLHGSDDIYWNKLNGIEAVRDAYKTARATDPSATLIYNDFVDTSGSPQRDRLPTFESVISQIKKDGNLDGIGLQIGGRPDTNEINRLRKVLDALDKYNLPIYVSEFEIITGENTPDNLARQAKVAADVIRLLKEYKNVVAVIAFPIDDRISNKLFFPNSNAGLWLKTDSGNYVPKPIVYTMMSVLAEP